MKYLVRRLLMTCSVLYVKSLKVLKLKGRSEFSNVWGEYINHSNPYIRGTTVPCDDTDSLVQSFIDEIIIHMQYV